MSRRGFAAVAVMFAVVATACDERPGAGDPLPSGSLGVVTPEAAREAMLGLCDLAVTDEAAEAEATFLDRSHATLHVIAAAAEAQERASASALLEAKQRVEVAVARDDLPPRFRRDVEALIGATRAAVAAIGLDAPACPS